MRRLRSLILFSIHCFAQIEAFTLLTFDVDGTLVRGSGSAEASAHSKAFSVVCGDVLGGRCPPVAETLDRREYQGSTDGLILLRLARAGLGVNASVAQLPEMMDRMYDFMCRLDDREIASGIDVLPGVRDHLRTLRQRQRDRGDVACGLVTGNVEGIARLKMKAVGIWDTGALSLPSPEQQTPLAMARYPGTEEWAFLGGFGSDFCSGDIDDPTRNYLDRSEQISIATRRCLDSLHLYTATASLKANQPRQLKRVVHIGDAPADVLAAKAFAENDEFVRNLDLCVGMVGVATGTYSAEELRQCAGDRVEGKWEPVILEDGMADPNFLNACGIGPSL